MTLFTELKRRHVFRIGIAYLVVAWLVVQVVAAVTPMLELPGWFGKAVLVLLAIGFPVALILAWAFEMTPEGVKLTDDLDEAKPKRRMVPTGRKLDFIIIGALALAVGFLVWRLNFGTPTQTARTAPVSEPAVAKPASDVLPNSVAVLPFENLSPKPDDAYFAAGLHEEVIDKLSKIRSMSVIARPSVMQYANGTKPIPEVARELHVETVMAGSVRFSDNRVRVAMQLVDAVTGTNLWTETYERPLNDIFEIEADIAMNVANALQAQFSPEEQARIAKAPTDSPEAYALSLQARSAYNRGDGATGNKLLQQAIEVDPQFALAYAIMATGQAVSFVNAAAANAVSADQRPKMEALSRQNAERALSIDPDLPMAHFALALPAMMSWRWSEADQAFAKAGDLRSVVAGTGPVYGYLLSWMGRHDEAIAVTKRNVELDPDTEPANYGIALAYAGRLNEATDTLEQVVAARPTYALARDFLAFVEIARGNSDAAVRQLQLSEHLFGDNPPIAFFPEWAYSYGRAGRKEDAQRLFDRIKAAGDKGVTPGAGGWAMAYLGIGDEKHALEWLEKGAQKAANHEPDQGLYQLMNLKMNVTNDPVLKKPEFVEVLSRIKGD